VRPNAHTPFSKSEVNKSSAPLFWVTILVSCGQDWCKKKCIRKGGPGRVERNIDYKCIFSTET